MSSMNGPQVKNKLHTETTSVHFHGEHFKGNQYMDGVPHVTQGTIPFTCDFCKKYHVLEPINH